VWFGPGRNDLFDTLSLVGGLFSRGRNDLFDTLPLAGGSASKRRGGQSSLVSQKAKKLKQQ